jgi:molybdopterin/thiamine biosynthesis adenylyltransferase
MLTDSQIDRYSRHIILKEVGGKGQQKLLAGRVLIIGAGGLGAPAALYLAAAGVGTIGIADADAVDVTNLQRQVIHFTPDVGKAKVESAAEKMRAINPDVTVKTYHEWITAANIDGILAGYDFVIDGTDNFAAKFLVNDACVLAGKPYSHAGILQFEGQALTVIPGKSTCFRCIFPEPPPKDAIPTCSQAGVLGVLPGVVGSIQATEAVKFLLGKGDLLAGRLLTYNALSMKFREVPIDRNPRCPACGENPTITGLRDEVDAMTVCDLGPAHE